MSHPSASVLLIGNEILSGRTDDKNLNYIAQKLLDIGIKVQECRVIPDDEEVIIKTVNALRGQHDYVFTTGGIGPTHDDITASCIARAFGVSLYENQEAVDKLEKRIGTSLTKATLKMAHVPEGCTLIQNPLTAAPGFIMENVYVMAGIPDVMHAMLETILPTLKGGTPVYSASVFCDLAESRVAPGLLKVQENYSSLEIGSYPHWPTSQYRLSLVVRGSDENAVQKAAQDIHDLVLSLDGKIVNSLTA